MVMQNSVCFPHQNKWNIARSEDQISLYLIRFAYYEPFKRENIVKWCFFSIDSWYC